MYRNSEAYDEIAKIVIGIYEDYNITSFPVIAYELCKIMGIKLVPYSQVPLDITKISDDAFLVPPSIEFAPKIYFNDKIQSTERIRFSIFHEIKHYVCNEYDNSCRDEDMTNYFARYIMCPIPYLIHKNIQDEPTIRSKFDVCYMVACNVKCNVINRRDKYGDKIFDYEVPLMKQLLGVNINEC